ncbi:amino acid permease [Strigomonas culicis]|uniref:Amino acid permease n=1 Tax=Strigomonas culicis TaxID=28005 RepID=S9UXT1_9TRYP|nr:amino acid permease [Strigomonas culicis]|eukprot:EPY19386.1 amino acid permease [Strigomonas culicis]
MNIAGSTIGGGVLGLPAGANQTGLFLGYIYVVLMVVLNVMSMRMIAITAQKTGIRSYEAMVRFLFPQRNYAFSYFVAFIRWFTAMGSCIAYVISLGDSFKPIFSGAHDLNPENSGYAYFMSANGLKVMTVIVFFCVMVPMVLPRHVDSLRHVSLVAIGLMLYFCVIVVVHSCLNGFKTNKHNVELSGHPGQGEEDGKVFLFRTGNPVVASLGTFVFAFICQTNAVEVYWDMAKHVRNPNCYTVAAGLALGICATIYTFVFTFGYFDFGAKKLGSKSILLMYQPMKEPEVMLAYVGVLVKLCVSYAMQSMSARCAVYYTLGFTERYANKKGKSLTFGKNKDKGHEKASTEVASTHIHVGQELRRPGEGGDAAGDEPCLTLDQSFLDNIPLHWHLLVVAILAAIALLLGLFIPDVTVVFNLAGSLCGSFLEFIIPALFLIYSGGFSIKRTGFFTWLMAYLMLTVGITAVVFGTGATIYDVAGGK